MIFGIGIDIQEIKAMDRIIQRQGHHFLDKVFTSNEITYCLQKREQSQHFAARWAVKEAFFKALGTGVSGRYRFLDVETIHLTSGQPVIQLHGMAEAFCRREGLQSHVSISHSRAYAVGQVILYYHERM